ncbi:MAG: flagellar hook-associated protein FlgK [Dehalococcoidia bacterium]|nr:flagellar hook-associated protein FlgK [Dehalococcoidia bacterium]
MGISIGLDIAVKALRAHQLAVDVASHNLANATSPGFSRQRVLLRPLGIDGSDHFTRDALLGRTGFGVDASDVNRVRDIFLDYQQRQALGQRTQSETQAQALEKAELVFNDPSDDGLAAMLAQFWNAWHDVVNDPEGSAARTTLVHTTTTLASRIQRAHSNLTKQRDDLNYQVDAMGLRINAIADELAQLNFQVKQVELSGEMANDLRDRRDLLLDQLAEIGNIDVTEESDHTVTVKLGNHDLVSGAQSYAVEVVGDGGTPEMKNLQFVSDGVAVDVSSGELRGLLDARDTDMPALIAKLDTLAAKLIESVNTLHKTGYGLDDLAGPPGPERDFFSGTGAADIALHADLLSDPNKIAAAGGAGKPGDGSVALQIAELQMQATLGTQTFEEYYSSMVAVLGADVSRVQGLAASNQLLTNHLEAMRQSVQGVNIDEEVANLHAAQYAYQAAARVITTIDEMLDTLINRMAV